MGNRLLTRFEHALAGTDLTGVALGLPGVLGGRPAPPPFERNADDFNFDTEIIVQLAECGKRILEIPIPTFYGDEICYVNGLKYARLITPT